MLDWLWKTIALLAGAVAVWFGARAKRAETRAERERVERAEAERHAVESALARLARDREAQAKRPPADAKRRDDFEGRT